MTSVSETNNKVAAALDNFVQSIGRWCSWLNVALIFAIILQVVLRYVFGKGLVVLEEVQWHLYCVGVVFGMSYCQSVDSHIRLDLVHEKMSRRTKEWVEIIGIIVLLMPMIYVIFFHGLDFFWEAVKVNERSDAPLGLCCRWLPKSLIPISMFLLFLSAVARLIKGFAYLKTAKKGA
ncbi:MAG: TRAP transporter small permease subunit [Desulfosarcinaceae bacterium]|nr:TRAP transporter small permease subunit [Desulfosarcinaceae bacterium]